MVMLQMVWWKEYFRVCAEYFYFPAVVFLFLRIAGRLEYCNLSILCPQHKARRTKANAERMTDATSQFVLISYR